MKFFVIVLLFSIRISYAQSNEVELNQGWNIFGYTCVDSVEVAQAFNPIVSNVILVKDNEGRTYIPEWGYNDLNYLVYGKGYQIKMSTNVDDFEFCTFMYSPVIDSLQAIIDDIQEEINNSPSCNLNDVNIGDYMHGGRVFYIDPLGENGLIIANEDVGINRKFEWGCDNQEIDGADDYSIGAGLQNTLDIINSCAQENIAAKACLDYQSNGYDDWYLPSRDELILAIMNLDINSYGSYGQPVTSGTYYSSTESSNHSVFVVSSSYNSYYAYTGKNNKYLVRPIRSFSCNNDCSMQISGCTDSLACNYNLEANLEDYSCVYSDFGFDCNGNQIEIYEVGDTAFGGIIFFVDVSGEHGLVAAPDDIIENAYTYSSTEFGFEWGCYNILIDGAGGMYYGEGRQNTIDILNSNCTPNSDSTHYNAAQAATNYTNEGFDDWYLPSIYELDEMHNAIGQGSPLGNVGGFLDQEYWSSTQFQEYYGRRIDFETGYNVSVPKFRTLRVRAVRQF